MKTRSIAFSSIVAVALSGCASMVTLPPPQAAPAAKAIQPALSQSAPAVISATPAGPTWASELVVAWPKGYTGGPVGYDMANGAKRFELPLGRADALNKLYFAALVDKDSTRVKTYTLHDGAEVGSITLPGRWDVAGLSPNGLYVALAQIGTPDEQQNWIKQNTWQTHLRVLDMKRQQVKHTLDLDGNFVVEAISNDGHSLFMLENLPVAKPDHYNVRQFDLWTERMNEYPLREKGNEEVMAGYAWDALASGDGEWLMTLYLNNNKKEAFVHALHLDYQLTVCIDLPSGDGDLERLKEYRLTLSADGKRLYAANAALGTMLDIALDDTTYPPYQIVYTTHFTPVTTPVGNPSLFTHSAFSPDGKTLYFTSANTAWSYNIDTQQVSRLPVEGALFGIGTSADGQRVYVNREQQLLPFDVVTGTALRFPNAAR